MTNDPTGKETKNSRISNNPTHVNFSAKLKNLKELIQMADLFGINDPEITKIKKDIKMYEKMKNIHDRFNDHFLKSGWIAYENMDHPNVLLKAVELADADKFNEAEEVLVEYYNETNLKSFVSSLSHIKEFKPRMELIERALEDFLEKRYHACIPVLLAMIDGVVSDLRPGDQRGFFATGVKLDAWDSISAHISGLTQLQELLAEKRTNRVTDEIVIPFRNGILHGRDLGYANKMVAVKVWATLFALVDGIRSMKTEEQRKTNFHNDPPEEMSEEAFYEKMVEIQSFTPRKLEVNKDYPEFGKSSDYEEGTPQKYLVEFFEHWSKNKPNLHEMTKKIDLSFEDRSLNHIIGILKRNIFKNQKLLKFIIKSIDDETVAITKIKVNLYIQDEDKKINRETTFQLCYMDSNGKSEIRGTEGYTWKIITGYGIEKLEDMERK
ncbi:hypothetical protein MBMB1_0095 [Methanobacterium sp. MB1]|nr:hypothetical protein MBMB1_0095 [Methanobacterium sp. MB1]